MSEIYSTPTLLLLALIPWLYQCDFHEHSDIPYMLNSPTEKHKLPKQLREISGLAYYSKDKLLTIQDERAEAFLYDLAEEEIKKKLDFGKDGDYEGIAYEQGDLFVIKTNGKVYTVESAWDKKERDKHHTNTKLSHKNNPEGLAKVPGKPELLIACKDVASDAPEHYLQRAIYSFDIEKQELQAEPKYLIDLESLHNEIEAKYPGLLKIKATEAYLQELFRPSGIDIHPITGDLYIISTVGKLLVILDSKGNFKALSKLNKEIFKQPEGICFEPDGDLYISNEGRGGKGNILFFKYLQ